MMQQKAIFSVLLRRFRFSLAAAPEHYVDNYAAMVVRPKQPFEVCYQRRDARAAELAVGSAPPPEPRP